MEAFRETGILPEALVNFLALMGWSPGDDREVMTLDELIEAFSLDRILKKASVFDAEKLEWLNSRHMDAMPAARLAPLLLDHLPEPERSAARDAPERLAAVADLVRQRTRTIDAMAEQARPFFTPLAEYGFEEAAMQKHWKDVEHTAERLRAVRELLAGATRFEAEALEADLRELAERQGIGAGKLFQPLRVALVGSDRSPGIFDVILLLGRDLVVARLDRALAELAIRRDPTAT